MITNKPYYEDEYTRLYHADCKEIISQMSDKCVDIILTDPPYGQNWKSNNYVGGNPWGDIIGDDRYPVEMIPEFFRLARNAVIAFCRWNNLAEITPQPKSLIVWDKGGGSMGDLEHEYSRQYEVACFWAMENHKWRNGRPHDIIRVNKIHDLKHPTEKNQLLLEKILEQNAGTSVLDCYAGSGSTLGAAKKLRLKSIGIEMEEKYCEVAANRLRDIKLDDDWIK